MSDFFFFFIDTNEFQETVELTLEVGCTIPRHKAYWKTLFYVAEGSVEFITEDSSVKRERGDFLAVEAGVIRSSKNLGNSEAKIIVIKSGVLDKEPEFV